MPHAISQEQVRLFLLKKHGLIGKSPFSGPEGILRYVQQVGCVQYDPVDVCGKSHELAFLARIKDFTPDMLARLLYQDRKLIDYWDKNMSILSTEDWPYLEPTREHYRQALRSQKEIDSVKKEVLEHLRAQGPSSSKELPVKGRVDWYWAPSSLSRAALEALYFQGDLIIHHKRHTVKSYALAADFLPAELLSAPNPCQTLADTQVWQALRRIGAVGMLWNRASDAWLGIPGFNAKAREQAFTQLEKQNKILPLAVEGFAQPLYLQTQDLPLLQSCQLPQRIKKEARFLAPLDCLLWDRKLISALFGFDYTWEIYTPEVKRQYSYYVLPVLYGTKLVGRIEPICRRKEGVLQLKRFWPEKGFTHTSTFRRAVEKEAEKLAVFHALPALQWAEHFWPPDLRPLPPE